ncbi:hypothetical protein COY16_00800 [Candidatus Roizmanbacteria bacterium CG_4_10_14_0_2_um_filter_39_13]|uniref:Uncharacterized protein n=1 Tax=Candidatus Roizmanbacteria bacterium CG_4_10_14_0_2_um_filter_39_13 TaxID=1974825 RepID=A0A2M7U1D5_9BACT|nr:MAG: hypothetical protein COY16_00800 [Candidatus Roizmanbacteria bacterium CG_4_10_14_0_2_um_filter_39_13]
MKYYLGVFTLLLIVIFTAPFLSKISRQSFVSDVFAYIPCEEDWECSEGQVCRTSDGRCVTDRTPTNPPAPTNTAAPQQPTSQPTTPPQQPPAGGDKTCWVSGQDQCQPNCQKQVNFSCSDGSNYSHIENCCGGNEGGNNTPTPIPPTPGPGDPTNPPTPVIPACSYTSGIKLQFKHAWLPSAVYSDTIQIREGEPVLVRAVAKPDGSTAIAAGFEFLVNGTVQSPMSAPVTELGYATPIGITSPNAPYTGVVTVKTLVPGFLLTDTNCTSTGQITVLPKLTKPIIPPEYMNPICNSDGWNSTFSWAKPPTDNRMDSFNLRINMTNLWMNNPPEALWFLNDASDQFIVTGNVTTKTSTIIPFRLYDGWSIQSIMANYPGTATADADAISSGNKFMCIPKYTAPTGTCLDDEGNLTDECDLNNWIAEYRRQYGYDGTNAVLNRLNAYPNLVTGENAYDAKDSANQPLELIDLLDFEALRKKLSMPRVATEVPTSPPTPIETEVTEGGYASDDQAVNPAGKDEEKAFDNNPQTLWSIASSSVLLQYDFGIISDGAGSMPVSGQSLSAQNLVPLKPSAENLAGQDAEISRSAIERYYSYIVHSYAITSANNNDTTVSPSSWIFQGSNSNSTTWTTLDTKESQVFTKSERKVFTISNETSYERYRLNISQNGGGTTTQVAELEMYARVVPSPTPTLTPTRLPTQPPTHTPTPSRTPTPTTVTPGPTNTPVPLSALPQLANGNFEQGRTGWVELENSQSTSSSKGKLIFSQNELPANYYFKTLTIPDPTYFAWLGGTGSLESTTSISQVVVLPSGYANIKLKYVYLNVSTEDNCNNDTADILINGTSIKKYPLCKDTVTKNNNGEVNFVNSLVDISANIGTSIELKFEAKLNNSLNSNFLIDHIELCSDDPRAPAGTVKCSQ